MNNNKPIYSIPLLGKYLRYYGVFTKFVGHRALLLGAISVFSTLSEGIGIALFVAYLQFLGTKGIAPSGVVNKMQSIFARLHISFTTRNVVLVLISVFALRGMIVFLGKSYHSRLYNRMSRAIMRELTNAVSSMRYSEYLKRNSGFFSHLFTKEVPRSILAFYQVAAIIPIVVSIITYLFLSVRMEWRFTILAGLFGGSIALLFRSVIHRTAALSREISHEEAKLSSLVIQLVQSFKYLFSTGSLEPLRAKVQESSLRLGASGARIGYLSAILPASSETIIVIFLGAMVYLQTEVFGRSVDVMLVSMMFLYRAMREATVLQGSWQAFNEFVGGVDVLMGTIDELNLGGEKTGGIALPGIRGGIDLRGVNFRYGDTPVLKNLNIHIPANSMIAFVGESGAGKSTLVDLLTSLMPPTSGMIHVDGIDYQELDRKTLRAQVGYVTQEGVIFDDTVANNVSLWRWQQDPDGKQKVQKALARANCAAFVEKFASGLQEIVGERGIRLSGGQRQRLSIARELYKNPGLLILDEATSALDSESERAVQESIDALKGSTTIVVIAHRLATVRNCDTIYVLRDGNIVESGGFEELKNRGHLFRKMCEAQSLV